MKNIFITSTGTDIGKTYLTSLLINKLKLEGKKVSAIKPIITGIDENNFLLSDSAVLLKAMSMLVNLNEIKKISPWIYRTPSSPYQAAEKEKKKLDYYKVVSWCNKKIQLNQTDKGFLFIEGIGGIMVPLVRKKTVINLVKSLSCPVILVVGSYLGSISHTLSAIYNLKKEGINIINVVVNESFDSSISIEDTVSIISDFSPELKVRICMRNSLCNDKNISDIIADINIFF